MQSFLINNFITLKLKNKKSEIYIDGEKFRQCKTLVINIQ